MSNAILTALVLYLSRGQARGSLLVQNLSKSRLGPQFAEWGGANRCKLLRHPNLQPRVATAQGSPDVGYVPLRLPEAEGLPHSILGNKLASDGKTVYRQSATFDGGTWPNPDGIDVPWGRVDGTSHPYLPGPPHPNPHIHEFVYDFKQGQWRSMPAKPFFGH